MQVIKVLIAALIFAHAPAVFAQGVSSKGTATVTFSKKITAAVKQDALQKAKVNAVDRYFSEANPAKARNFDLMRTKIMNDIDTYVLDASILDEELNEKLGTYKVIVSASINVPRLENALVDTSAVANATAGEKSMLTFVFVARYQKSVKSFDDRVLKRADVKLSESANASYDHTGTESEHIDKSSVSTGDKAQATGEANYNASATTETGGSTTRKADEVEWNVAPAAELDMVMTGAFADARYDVVAAEDVEAESGGQLSIAAIRTDFGTGNDLSPTTRRSATNGARVAGVKFLALGTMDIGAAGKDPATGLTRVYVTVTGEVLDVSSRLSRKISAVGPEQFAGIGPDADVARRNALKLAADSAAQKLLNSLNAKGVQ
jgi:hypothetical protein